MTAPIPMALESGFDPRSDVFNRLLKNRVIMLGSDVNDDIANQICAQLLYLEGEDPNADIWLYVNSP
jgi:ATP-dependent Clp protease protease subunit